MSALYVSMFNDQYALSSGETCRDSSHICIFCRSRICRDGALSQPCKETCPANTGKSQESPSKPRLATKRSTA